VICAILGSIRSSKVVSLNRLDGYSLLELAHVQTEAALGTEPLLGRENERAAVPAIQASTGHNAL
jgi:hypothetical protein